MQRYTNILVNGSGNVVAGASVQVLTMPSGSLASIYSDNGITSASNPLITDASGSFTFYAADGTYSLLISGNGIQSETVSNIILTSPLYGPTGPQGNSIVGPTGPASTVAGPTGPTGSASTTPGPTGPQGNSITGPTGPASTVAGPTGPTGAASTVPGPTGPAGSTTYPGVGIANSTGTAWGTSYSNSNPIPVTIGGTGLITLTAGYIPYGNGTNALASSANFFFNGTALSSPFYIATETISTSLNAGAYSYGTLTYSDVNIVASYHGNVNNYVQTILSNASNGTAASTDYIVGNNNTTASTYFGDFGMNSSGWTGSAGTNSFNAPNMVFLTSTSADLLIGTTTANAIRFAINGGADSAQITSAGTFISTSAPNIGTITSASTITPTVSSGQYNVTALAAAATIAIPTGTVVDGQRLMIRIKDNGTARALTWTTTSGGYRAQGVTLPTTTVISTPLYVGCVYNAQDTYWDVLAVS